MKLQQPSLESNTGPVWVDEIWTFFQCGVVLLLGYVVTRAWLCYRSALTMKAKLQQINDIDFEDYDSNCKREANKAAVATSPARAKSSRQTNAQMRKRTKKGRGSESSIGAHTDVTEEAAKKICFESGEHDKQEQAHSTPVQDEVALRNVSPSTGTSTNYVASSCLDMGVHMEGAVSTPITDVSPARVDCPSSNSDGKQVVLFETSVENEEESPLCKVECEEPPIPVAKLQEKSRQMWADISDDQDEEEEAMRNEAVETSKADIAFENQKRPSHDIYLPMMPCPVDWDLIESDSDDDEAHGIHAFGSPPENAPVLWCSPPQTPMNAGDSSMSLTMTHVDSWVPVAIPTECVPPGTLDGRWMNLDGERILIERLEIMFESGVTWNMNMHSPTRISVEVEGAEFVAELDEDGENLIWSDGDVWNFHGRVQVEEPQKMEAELQPSPFYQHFDAPPSQNDVQLQPSWGYDAFGNEISAVEPMQAMWDGTPVPEGFMMFPDQGFAEEPIMRPLNETMPSEAKEWEICWDWKKKGCCPRGVACDWYHPPAAPCQPCDTPFFQ